MKNANTDGLGGFTLIELLVVVLIIGILTAVAFPQYEKAVEKSRAAEAISLVSTIAAAEEVYYMANGDYSGDINLLDVDIPGKDIDMSGLPAKRTKNFACRSAAKTSFSDSSIWSDLLATCNRIPSSSYYAIGKLKDGKIVCRYYTEKGRDVCKSVGKEGTSTHLSGQKDYILN